MTHSWQRRGGCTFQGRLGSSGGDATKFINGLWVIRVVVRYWAALDFPLLGGPQRQNRTDGAEDCDAPLHFPVAIAIKVLRLSRVPFGSQFRLLIRMSVRNG